MTQDEARTGVTWIATLFDRDGERLIATAHGTLRQGKAFVENARHVWRGSLSHGVVYPVGETPFQLWIGEASARRTDADGTRWRQRHRRTIC